MPQSSRLERRRQQRDPRHHFDEGRRFLNTGQWAQAASAFAAAVKLAPRAADTHQALGVALLRLNRFDEAAASFEKAVRLRPDHAPTHADLGFALGHAGRFAESIAPLDRALALDPSLSPARYSLGLSLARTGDVDRALALIEPTDAEGHLLRGVMLLHVGRIVEAEQHFLTADGLRPGDATTETNLAVIGQYLPDVTAAALHQRHRRFHDGLGGAVPAANGIRGSASDAENLPVIGFVSGDFRRHAVGSLTVRVVEGLARHGARLACFANQSEAEADAITARYRAAAAWHSIHNLDDTAAASLIAREKIDVLVDLSGHTARNRLRLFLRRPAPVQVTWAGYAGTTGLTVFDGLIADPIEVPSGEDCHYSEPVIRLPFCYTSFDPPAAAPAIGPLPAAQAGFVTFGSFNRPAKLDNAVLALWGEILNSVPASRLLLNYSAFASKNARDVVTARLKAAGVTTDRISFGQGGTQLDMLRRYQEVDIGLDTFPYSGGVTTLEALWMGVPVVSLRGRSFAGRHGATHLHTVGLDHLVSEDPRAYVAMAVALAGQLDKLAALRAELRDRVARSPLCDGALIAGHFLGAVTGLWRDRCRNSAQPSIGCPPSDPAHRR